MNILTRSLPTLFSVAVLLASSTASAAPDASPTMEPQAAQTTGYVGLVAVEMPKYPGSSGTRGFVLPIGAIVYQERYFASALDGIGLYLYQDNYWKIGTALTLDVDRRHASDSPRTAGLGNIPESVRADVFASFDSRFATAHVSLGQDVSGSRTGLLGEAKVAAKWSPVDRLSLDFGPGATWGNARYMQTWFGISSAQSATTGVAEHTMDGGLASVYVRLGASLRLDTRWRIDAGIERTRLAHAAADSPVVEQRLGTAAQIAVVRVF
jgi:outer membrane protein